MDYRIEKRGAFQIVCKRKRVDKPQSGTATREISDMRQEFGANGTPERLIAASRRSGHKSKIEASLRTSPQAGSAVPWILLECSDVLVRA